MRVPEAITDRLPSLAILDEDWEPVSQVALAGWIIFYGIVLLGVAGGGGVARWFDLVFVPIHEGGHLLFGWFGSHWLMVAGGTLLQLFVPLALAVYFTLRRQIPGTAFCGFFFFEQFLPVGTYMADSRSQSLTYVTVGDPDLAEHDWSYLFSHAGLINYDVQIGGAVRFLGVIGMLGVVGWLIWRAWQGKKTAPVAAAKSSGFGELGLSFDDILRSGFWQWFHLDKTRETNGVHRFQPDNPQFHQYCYVDVSVAPTNETRTITMGLQRAFVSGPDEPFARDLVRSFLCVVFPKEKSEAVAQFVDELGTEFGGSRTGTGTEVAPRRLAPGARPSPLYLVFLGQGKRCAMKSGALTVEVENISEGATPWLCVRLRPGA